MFMEANMDRFLVHCGPKCCSAFQSNSSYLVTPQNQFFKKNLEQVTVEITLKLYFYRINLIPEPNLEAVDTFSVSTVHFKSEFLVHFFTFYILEWL